MWVQIPASEVGVGMSIKMENRGGGVAEKVVSKVISANSPLDWDDSAKSIMRVFVLEGHSAAVVFTDVLMVTVLVSPVITSDQPA